MSYWPNSPEAQQVFHPNTLRKRRRGTTTTSAADNNESFTSYNESAKEAVERRILLLKSVHESEDGWRNVILGRDADNTAPSSRFLRFGRGQHSFVVPIRL
jgi:hypothetical protein